MAVKVDGSILREFDKVVYLPFGTEYTLFFKNTSTRRVKIKVTVDGQDVMDGSSLVIEGNSTSELKRFIKNSNLHEGNSFKFIEKTEKVSKHRGDRIDDGLITVEYEFEKEQPKVYFNPPHIITKTAKSPQPNSPSWWNEMNHSTYSDSVMSMDAASTANVYRNVLPQNTAGITAPGSHNNQQFSTSTWNGSDLSTKSSMTLEMKGVVEEVDDEVNAIINNDWQKTYGHSNITILPKERRVTIDNMNGIQVSTSGSINIKADKLNFAITTKSKVKCSMCGSEYKAGTKFCSECGTSLKIY